MVFVPLHGPASLPSQLQADLVVSQEAVLACVGALQDNVELSVIVVSNIQTNRLKPQYCEELTK